LDEVKEELGEDWIESSSSLSSGFFMTSPTKQNKTCLRHYVNQMEIWKIMF